LKAGKIDQRACSREASLIQEDYTVDGKKDAFGNVIHVPSLKHLMSLLTDFIEEETLLQYHGRLLGVKGSELLSAIVK
jgi:hypothetical protein